MIFESNLVVKGHYPSIVETRGQTLSWAMVTRRTQISIWGQMWTDHWQVDLHRSMDFMNFEAFCEASPADTYISWLRISQSFCETLSSGNSSTFLRLCVTDWNNRQLRHDNLIIGGCCISESDFGSCQGAIVSELSLQMFLGDTVTRCDRFTFPDYRNQSDYIFPFWHWVVSNSCRSLQGLLARILIGARYYTRLVCHSVCTSTQCVIVSVSLSSKYISHTMLHDLDSVHRPPLYMPEGRVSMAFWRVGYLHHLGPWDRLTRPSEGYGPSLIV